MYIHLIFYDLLWLATSEFYIYSVYTKCFITTVYTQTIILHNIIEFLPKLPPFSTILGMKHFSKGT